VRIDIHIHFQPPELLAYLATHAGHEPYWALLLAPNPTTGQPPAAPDADRMLVDMDRAGIDRAVIQGEYYRQHESCVAANDRALALQRRYPERFLVFATVQPADERAHDEVQRCAAAGAVGIGELNPYAQGFRLDSPAFLRLAERCIDLNLPILLHVNEPVGRYYPGKAVTPLVQYYDLAVRYPELKLILAHWGGGLFFYELIPSVRRALRNVWYDTAASPLLYPTADVVAVALRCLSPHKILFGSDYPLPLYPRRSREPDVSAFLNEIMALDIAPDVRDDHSRAQCRPPAGIDAARRRITGKPRTTPENPSLCRTFPSQQPRRSPLSPQPGPQPAPSSTHTASRGKRWRFRSGSR
jgi:predicted TIM-barrel fold metal-dependent hydrolase